MAKPLQQQLDGQISILFQEDGLVIEVTDPLSSIRFLDIKLDAGQTCEALSRRTYTSCKMDIRGLHLVGKKMLMGRLEFEMPEHTWENRKEIAYQEALEKCLEGWEPDNYFGSQNSFYQKDGKEYARAIIRKWE